MNPSLPGFVAVLIWGATVPLARFFEQRFGLAAYIGFDFTMVSALGIAWQVFFGDGLPHRTVFRSPYLYGRWICFLLHQISILSAIVVVHKENVSFVILLNYLWPTAIIVSSILFAGVKITRIWAFLFGSAIVLASLSLEILGPEGITAALFADRTDCFAYALALMAALTWGIYSALSKRGGAQSGGGSVIPIFQATLAPLLLLSFVMPELNHWENFTGWWMIGLSAMILGQFIAYRGWDISMRCGNIVILSLFADFIPWMSLLTAHLVLEVDIGMRTAFAVVSLVAGAMITRYGTLPKKHPEIALKKLEADLAD